MYTVTKMQDTAGHFETLDTCDTLDDAIASAKCEVDGEPNLTSVYVFNDQTYMGRTYPYLVAKITTHTNMYVTNEIEVAYA